MYVQKQACRELGNTFISPQNVNRCHYAMQLYDLNL